jgi:hypothetical protein
MSELYIDQIVNWLFCFRDQINRSLWFVNWTLTSLSTKWCQACKLLPAKDLLKATFKGFDLKTVATVALFFCTILYKDGYWLLKGVSSSHASS